MFVARLSLKASSKGLDVRKMRGGSFQMGDLAGKIGRVPGVEHKREAPLKQRCDDKGAIRQS